MNSNIMAIQFHDQSLSAILVDSIPHVALKPICENIGIDWEAQRQKINRHPVLSSVACMIKATGTDGKLYEMLMLPIKYLNGWLFGVDTNRVKNGTREKLIEYQRECFDVLANHFMPKLQTPHNPKAPRAKFALTDGVSLESQDLINDMIADILVKLPKENQGSIAKLIRSAILTKYDLKGVKHGYKNIPDEQFTNVLNLIARLPIEADQYLTYTKEELNALIQSEVAKALPPPAKEGELASAANTIDVNLKFPDGLRQIAFKFNTEGFHDGRWFMTLSDGNVIIRMMDQNEMAMTFDKWINYAQQERGYVVIKKADVVHKLLA